MESRWARYFLVVSSLFVLYKARLYFVHEILKCGHSNETYIKHHLMLFIVLSHKVGRREILILAVTKRKLLSRTDQQHYKVCFFGRVTSLRQKRNNECGEHAFLPHFFRPFRLSLSLTQSCAFSLFACIAYLLRTYNNFRAQTGRGSLGRILQGTPSWFLIFVRKGG